MSLPTRAMTGIRRTVKGDKEVAKWVASRALATVAWSIESASVWWDGLSTSNTPRGRLIFQAASPPCGGTEASCREKATRFTAKSLAVARLHPFRWTSSGCDGRAHDPAKVDDQVQFLARTWPSG